MESRFAIVAPQTCPGFTNQSPHAPTRLRLSYAARPDTGEGTWTERTTNLLLGDTSRDRGICEMRKMSKAHFTAFRRSQRLTRGRLHLGEWTHAPVGISPRTSQTDFYYYYLFIVFALKHAHRVNLS